jgi:ATP/ADP translocase
MMNRSGLISLFQKALKYVEKNHQDELRRAKNTNSETFKKLTSSRFLEEYCWAVYTSGFRVCIVEGKFDGL